MLTEQESFDLGVTTVSERARMVRALICEEVARIVPARCGNALRAVVLTGSVARDEGTVVRHLRGWKVLGDAELYLVFHDRAALPTPETIAAVCEEVSKALAKRGLLIPIGFSPVNGSYFERMPHHILTYELRACGCVVWGDAAILDLIPAFTPAEISLEDAWRLLANRMIEQLEAIGAEPMRGLSSEAQYRLVKLYLDMATSFLVFRGQYEPSYAGRAIVLRRIAESAPEAKSPLQLKRFSTQVSVCTTFKLQGGDLTRVIGDLWPDAIESAHALWRWELQRLTYRETNLSDFELLRCWARLQPLGARLRGWISLLRRCELAFDWRTWSRWLRLASSASPRYCVYSAASTLFFGFPTIVAQDGSLMGAVLRRAIADLPLYCRTKHRTDTEAYFALARETASQYRRFLETTVA